MSAKDVGKVGITDSALSIDSADDGGWCAKQVLGWYKEAGITVNLGNNFGPRVGPTGAPGGSLLEGIQQSPTYQFFPGNDQHYKPQVGDLVFFVWSTSPPDWHIGMIVGEHGGQLITREGDSYGPQTGNELGVNENEWNPSSGSIVGYGRILTASSQAASGSSGPTGTHPHSHPVTYSPTADIPGVVNYAPPPGSYFADIPGAGVPGSQAGTSEVAYALPPAAGVVTSLGGETNPVPGSQPEYGPTTVYTEKSLVTIPSGLTVAQLNQMLAGTGLAGLGEAFHHIETVDDVNALFAIAHSANESAWGTSNIAVAKNNIFGMGADDKNPFGDAYPYSSFTASVYDYGAHLANNYLRPGQQYYAGDSIYDIFVHYSSSHSTEPRTIVGIMNTLLGKLNSQG
jgi:hypothetical protein